MTIPGIGPITATAVAALAPSARTIRRGRDFAAWLGLTPLQRSSGGKQKLGETSRMGERTLRRMLIIGASATVRWAMRKGATDPWLSRMLSRKPPMLVIVALAKDRTRRVGVVGQGLDLQGTGIGRVVRSPGGPPKFEKVERRVWRYG